MALRIEDYAIIGDCKSAALVGSDGSIDWLCWPRFDSSACFAALLGTTDNGRWLIAPALAPLGVKRRYRPGTLVLETEFQTESGRATIIDFMPPADGAELVRIVVGGTGRVDFRTEYVARFDYGSTVPWISRLDDGVPVALQVRAHEAHDLGVVVHDQDGPSVRACEHGRILGDGRDAPMTSRPLALPRRRVS